MTDAEIAWLAALLEGEGYFSVTLKTSTTGDPYPALLVRLNMTDEDVVRRAQAIAGTGTIRGPVKPTQENRKPYWAWTVHRRADLVAILSAIRPWMGQRRGARIDEMLAIHESTSRPVWRHGTRQGYDKYGCRCGECTAANTARIAAYRARRKAINARYYRKAKTGAATPDRGPLSAASRP